MRSSALLRVIVVPAVLALIVLTAACGGSSSSSAESGTVTGSGAQMSKTYDLSGFTGVRVEQAVSAVIAQGDAFAVTASANENLVQYLRIRVEGDTLVVGLDPSKTFRLADVSVEVVLPELTAVEATGAADVYVDGFKSAGDLTCTVAGGARLNMDRIRVANAALEVSEGGRLGGSVVVGDAFKLTASGAGQGTFRGKARTVELTASEASVISLKDVVAQTATVVLTDASKASVHATRTLNVAMTGASGLDYYGEAELGHTDITGASQLNHIQQ